MHTHHVGLQSSWRTGWGVIWQAHNYKAKYGKFLPIGTIKVRQMLSTHSPWPPLITVSPHTWICSQKSCQHDSLSSQPPWSESVIYLVSLNHDIADSWGKYTNDLRELTHSLVAVGILTFLLWTEKSNSGENKSFHKDEELTYLHYYQGG